MAISRSMSVKVQWVLDQLVPPIIRDSRWFMYPPMKLVLKDQTNDFMGFKSRAFGMSGAEFGAVYDRVGVVEFQGETDLNAACTEEIIEHATGKTILEVGCGRGYLVGQLLDRKKEADVTGCDIALTSALQDKYQAATLLRASMEDLPFEDNSFDTVITTHTLEHVQNLQLALSELRRVARNRLIVVVPKQRPYKYNFSLHIHFFPYAWSLVGQFGYRDNVILKELDGDWYYQEDYA